MSSQRLSTAFASITYWRCIGGGPPPPSTITVANLANHLRMLIWLYKAFRSSDVRGPMADDQGRISVGAPAICVGLDFGTTYSGFASSLTLGDTVKLNECWDGQVGWLCLLNGPACGPEWLCRLCAGVHASCRRCLLSHALALNSIPLPCAATRGAVLQAAHRISVPRPTLRCW